MDILDVAIVGGGPAGASCATFCARAGLKVVVLERERFPREKVCGDCLNPSCWPVLERLKVAEAVRELPHSWLKSVDFIAIDGSKVTLPLPAGKNAEIAVHRSHFDQLLLQQARTAGASVREQTTLSGLTKAGTAWMLATNGEKVAARIVVAADGRNSTVARLANLLPRAQRERVALQSHIPLPSDFGSRVVLEIRPEGYSGQAPLGENQLNLCLVSVPGAIDQLKDWAHRRFGISPGHNWRSITPLTRPPISPARQNLFLIGDAARVVEPFTGEGIYYALRSGELAAEAIIRLGGGEDSAKDDFFRAHAAMYRGRLWINQLARAAVLSPRIASKFVHLARVQPAVLRILTRKIVS